MQSSPNAPNAADSYKQGIVTYLTYLPDLLKAEQNARTNYDPQRVQDQQQLQDTFGATQYQQQLDALNQLDPQSRQIRGQLAQSVSNDLAAGRSLTPEQETQLTSRARGAQAARGNDLSTAAGGAEALYKTNAAEDAYYRRLGAAGTFLGTPGPVQQAGLVQAVQPDRTSAYVNPASGYAGQNFALQNYGNLLAQNQQQNNQWSSALGGAASGATAGGQYGGGWGALIGGVTGGAAGYFSDRKLKYDIREAGEMNGFKLYYFRFISDPLQRLFRGVMADEVQRVRPDAVSEERGFLKVNYAMIGVPFVEVA